MLTYCPIFLDRLYFESNPAFIGKSAWLSTNIKKVSLWAQPQLQLLWDQPQNTMFYKNTKGLVGQDFNSMN